MGVPGEYVVEFFAPSLTDYKVFHNVSAAEMPGETAGDDGPAAPAPQPQNRPVGAPAR
jgi:hypothetical protein